MVVADEIPDDEQRVGRLFRRRWPRYGKYESGNSAGAGAVCAAASGKRLRLARARAEIDRLGEDNAEVAEICGARCDGDDGTRRRKTILLQFAESMLREPHVAAGGSGSVLLRENERRGVQGCGVSFIQLGDILARVAGSRARAVHGPVVVHRRVYRRAAAIDGCILGGTGMGARE